MIDIVHKKLWDINNVLVLDLDVSYVTVSIWQLFALYT